MRISRKVALVTTSRIYVVLLLALISGIEFSTPGSIFAQMDEGTITGTVKDITGAVIPKAEIILTSNDTGLVLRTNADDKGDYTFSPVKIGHYSVSATAPGFASTKQQNLLLNVQATLEVPLTMKPGSVSDTVLVTSAPPLLQSQSGSVGQVMSTETINNLPLNGRNAVYVAQLAPGVVSGIGGRGLGYGDFIANGQRPTQNNFILDGIDNNSVVPAFGSGASYIVSPPPDALAEFNLQTSNYSAELSHSAGAVMNTAVRSGTNIIHGDLWEYNRNTIFDATDWNALSAPDYHENQFGATLGAPILKNRLFYFGYAEANRIVFGNPTSTLSVPTQLMRTGDFSELLNKSLTSQGAAVTLYQPGSAGTVPLACSGKQNVICLGNIDQVALKILNLYPLPNTNNGKLYNNYVTNTNAVANSWQWGSRLDWNLSSKDQMFVRYSYMNEPANYPAPLGPILDEGSSAADGTVSAHTGQYAFSETHIFSPSLVNEIRFGGFYGAFEFQQAAFNSPNLAASLGLGGIPVGDVLGGSLPIATLTGITGFGPPSNFPQKKNEDLYEFRDNVTKIHGSHSFKAGLLFQAVRIPFFSPGNAHGTYTFSGYFTSNPAASNTGYGPADFLLDQIASATLGSAQPLDFSRWTRGVYFQDDWRVLKRLTLNLGLRYDSFQPQKEVAGQFADFNAQPLAPGSGQATLTYTNAQKSTYLSPTFLNMLSAYNIPVQYTGNEHLVNGQNLNFAPRLGFAFNVNDKTVINGGFGMFFGGQENTGADETLQNYPFQFSSSFPRPSTCVPGNCPTNGMTLETGFSSILSSVINNVSTPSFSGTLSPVKTTYTEAYNLSVQRSITNNMVATVAYVGNVDRHLIVNTNLNSPMALIDPRTNSKTVEPFPNLGNTIMNENIGVSSYNSFQAKLEKRYQNGLSFLTAYTWAHSLDDATQPVATGVSFGYRAVNMIGIQNDYTNSSGDVRHRVAFNGYYQLPFGHGERFLSRNALLDALAGGWAGDAQFTAQTGVPFTVGTNLGNAGPNGGTAYAVLVGNPFASGGTPDPSNPSITCAASTRTKSHWYNPCAFANPPLAFPNASISGSPVSTTKITGTGALPYLGGRNNQIHGPGFERVNMSLFKRIPTLREEYLELRADVFNVLNTPSYGNPSTTTDATTGGQITGPQTFQSFAPDSRFIQVSAKYSF